MKREDLFIAPGAVCMGDVALGKDCSIWYHATVRADRAPIKIGSGSNIQDNCVVHVDKGFPVTIGNYVTVGHGAILHGCQVGDGSLIGMGAIILNGAKIGRNCIVAAGALVTQNTEIPDGMLAMGSPAKVIRKLSEEEIASNRKNAEEYIEEAREYVKRTV
ncbi:MAG: gamma carbonic anhydrase family protein [Lachnospiraceae bacterium]|nr:gamma carbonic anhydrase family protein [Lachnospiraceae bacterium]MDY4068768.1 gamma carbonic anhydrase family protein [Lachnospiraceae bacterium]